MPVHTIESTVMITVAFCLLFSSVTSSTLAEPFDLRFDYDDQQVVKRNFTVTMDLHAQPSALAQCENNRSCLVDLSLEMQSDELLVEVWCQPPAYSKRLRPVCLLPTRNATDLPSITMVVNVHDLGDVVPMGRAKFARVSNRSLQVQATRPIAVAVRDFRGREEGVSW